LKLQQINKNKRNNKMNKNSKRFKNMNELMSKCFNAEYKDEKEKERMKSKKVIQELTEMGVFR
jgi:predicted transcriptional regulator YheO